VPASFATSGIASPRAASPGSAGNRRLTKNFEIAETLAIFVTLASIQLAIRRFARALVEIRKCMDSRPSPTPGPAAGLRREPTSVSPHWGVVCMALKLASPKRPDPQ
jgi:hypothetical protein